MILRSIIDNADLGRAIPSGRATHAPHRAVFHRLGLSVGIAIADAVAVVPLVTLFIRWHLVLLSQADGWSYGAANIGLAVFLWGLMRACLASGMEARRAAAENTDAVHDSPTAASGDAQPSSAIARDAL